MLAFRYEVFYEVASRLSFSKAAEVLYISQPAVSKQIKGLENEIGIPLFARKGNRIDLTSSGTKLYNYLQKAKVIQRQIQSDIDIIKNQWTAKGELKIGASTTISLYVMPKVLSVFRKRFPQVKILLINRNSENVLKALVNQEIDLAIIEAHHQINSVQHVHFMKDEIIPVCCMNSPYARGEIKVKDLMEIPLALRERGSGTLAFLTKALTNHQLKQADLNIIARLGGTEALKNYLLEDESVGFLSRLSVQKELGEQTLREIKIKGLQIERSFNFVTRTGEEPVGIIKAIIKEAKALYNLRS